MKKNLLILAVTLSSLLGAVEGSFAQQTKIMDGDYRVYFEKAYLQYPSIPKGVLEAVAYTNTHIHHIAYDMAAPENCMGMPGAYGVMGLILDGKNYFNNNLSLVSVLSGVSENDIINDPQKHILAYAGALNAVMNSSSNKKINSVEGIAGALTILSELPYNDEGQIFALNTQLYSYLTFLNDAAFQSSYKFPNYNLDLHTFFGEENFKVLSSSNVTVSEEKIFDSKGNTFKGGEQAMSSDYAPAIWNAAASCNYGNGRSGSISAVAIHDVEGSYAGCISWFKNCNANVSAHYVVRSSDGQITQMVLESNTAYHVANHNSYTIGIEHEGYANQTGWYTTAMYNASAGLVKDICNSGYGINPTTAYNGPACNCQQTLSTSIKIKGHQHYSITNGKVDPGINWDWANFYSLINNSPPPPPPTPPANDNCSAAISLTPNTTCITTSGTIANATTSGLTKASCDASSSSSLKDVWYKFTATATTHTITLTPSSGLDGVLSLYATCSGTQLGCSDNGGGPGGVEKIIKSGLTVGTTYFIRIYSYGSSTPSTNTFSICVIGSGTVSCGVPSGLSASALPAAASLTWNAVSGATSYNIRYKAVASSTWTNTTSTTNSKSISGLTASTQYEFQVQTVCSSGTSAYSSSATFTTGSNPTASTATVTIGSGTSAYSAHPFSTIYMDERTEYIITKSELTAAGWTSSTPNIKSLAFQVSSAAAQAMNGFTLSLAHTTNSSFTGTTFLTGTNSTTVYSGTVTATAGWNTYTFTTPFAYNGTDNLLIKICWNNSSYTSNSSILATSYSNYMALYYRADVASGGVCSQSTGTQSFYRPNTKIGFSSGSTTPPPAVDCNKTLKTTVEGFNVYQHNASGALMFKAKFAVDADGSPRAYGPNDSGLDYTANAGYPGNWWGVVTDGNGNPVVQGSGDPFPGMYVSTTSLYNSSYATTNPLRYVNAETVPFFVLPAAVKSIAGIQNGDIAYVYNTTNGLGCYAVLADQGPAGKLGEGSIYLANQLGINSNPKNGGTSSGIIDYIVFPNSGYGQGTIPTIAQINSIGSAKLNSIGGTGITTCLPIAPPPSDSDVREGDVASEGIQNSLTIYPNPSDGILLNGKIYGTEEVMMFKIYDMTGKEIFSKQIVVNAGEFSISFADEQLKTGMYMLVGIANDKQYTQRIIVK